MGLMTEHRVDVRPIFDSVDRVKTEIAKVVVGQENTVDMLMAAMLTGGHVLLEGLPGIAKTLTAKLLAKTIDAGFSRIQFTPDLMPTDVTGTSVFNVKESSFYFRKGPIFSNIILIDEINRSPAKTQAALMEVMEEKQITYDGETYIMSRPFFVIATQNPIEQEGTYSLPEAELDRFVFKLKLSYPSLEQELAIIEKFHADFDARETTQVNKILSPEAVTSFSNLIEKIYVRTELLKYIAAVVDNTRNNGDLFIGASPRASLAIIKTAKALAAIRGREFVTPDDIKNVAVPVLNHRLILSHEREMEGFTVEDIIKGILETVEVPR
ncbi:MAG: AAA family ATPase [Flavobacteriales bacterium]